MNNIVVLRSVKGSQDFGFAAGQPPVEVRSYGPIGNLCAVLMWGASAFGLISPDVAKAQSNSVPYKYTTVSGSFNGASVSSLSLNAINNNQQAADVQYLWNLSSAPFTATDNYLYGTATNGGCVFSDLTGVNDSGQVLGYKAPTTQYVEGYICNPDGSTQNFVVNTTPGSFTYPYGINNSGQVVGYYSNSSGTGPTVHGFLYVNGAFTTLDFPNSTTSAGTSTTTATYMYGINSAGQIVGYYLAEVVTANGTTSSVSTPFIYSNGAYTPLPNVPVSGALSITTIPTGINDNGQIVGYYTGLDASSNLLPEQGFLYTPNNTANPWSTLTYQGAKSTCAFGINNSGQVVGTYSTLSSICRSGSGEAGFVANPISASFVDPIPLMGTAGSLLAQDIPAPPAPCRAQTTPPITTCPNVLGSQGTVVQGVSADGVSQLVIRVPANFVGEHFNISLSDATETGSSFTNDDGGLALIGTDPLSASVSQTLTSVAAVETNPGGLSQPMVFAIYRAPIDFARSNGADNSLASRTVQLQFTSTDTTGYAGANQILIVRPPVILAHGIWSNPGAWNYFNPLWSPFGSSNIFWVTRLDYQQLEPYGVLSSITGTSESASEPIAHQLSDKLLAFKLQENVAAVQTDWVVHSLGGLIARALALQNAASPGYSYARYENFQQGDIHKLITLDTPHKGSQFADNLAASPPLCQGLFSLLGHPLDQSVQDLRPSNSALLPLINKNGASVHLRANVFVGIADSTQTNSTQKQFAAISGAVADATELELDCSSLLPNDSFTTLFNGNSDLIVSVDSQSANGIGVNGVTVPSTTVNSVIHASLPVVFPYGPDILGSTASGFAIVGAYPGQDNPVADLVISLLNTPVNGSTFGQILP